MRIVSFLAKLSVFFAALSLVLASQDDCSAGLCGSRMHEKVVVSSPAAPPAIGPYNQAIITNGLVYVSGQLGFDPKTGALVEGGVEAQTRQALENLRAILTEAKSSTFHAVKVTVLMTDMANYAAINSVYSEYFSESRPARVAYAVSALPAGGLVEIDCIAIAEQDP